MQKIIPFLFLNYTFKIHTLIVYSIPKNPKFKYTIEITASKVHRTQKIHTLVVYP